MVVEHIQEMHDPHAMMEARGKVATSGNLLVDGSGIYTT